ncbi:MAG: caspase family protein [Cyanobacteria bacterium J06598_3]
MSGVNFSQSLAVVIGIDRYGHGISPLRTAVGDAGAIAQLLENSYGYQVISLLNEKAQLSALQTLIQEQLPSILADDSRLLFYFAGHGIAQDGDGGPAGYLIPQDAVPGEVGSYLPMVDLHDALTVLPCRHFLAVFDCCFAGAFRWSSTRDIDFVPGVIHQERFDRFCQDPAWQVITSAAYDQRAMDVLSLRDDRGTITGEMTDQQHSPFAAALMQALQGGADTSPPAEGGRPAGDGVITATELYLYLRDRVERLTQSQRKRQTPELCSLRNHDKGEYVFLPPGHVLNLPPAPALNPENNPYRGLESFDEAHSDLFFGRDAEIEQLLKKVADPHPLTVVLGASGTGKSSLVKAGLLPRLVNHSGFQVLPVMRPGAYPLEALARACQALVSPDEMSGLTEKFATDQQALAQLIDRWQRGNTAAHESTDEPTDKFTHEDTYEAITGAKSEFQGTPKKLLLVIDQAEELITQSLSPAEAIQFQQIVKRAMAEQGQFLQVIATLRLDFEAQFQDQKLHEGWMDSRFVVPPMTQVQLREAIEQPAAQRVLYFEPHSLVDKLIEDVSQTPGALPLLSFTLSELYLRYLQHRSDNRALQEADYRALGGVSGALTRRATEEYGALVAQDAVCGPMYGQAVKQVMLRMLAVEGGELARRRVPRSELVYADKAKNGRVQLLLKRFIAARLVVQGQEKEGEPYVEPAHDALVRGWDKLLRWKTKEQVNLALQRQLTPQALNWQQETRAGRGRQAKGFLWDDNPRLGLLKEVLASEDNWLNGVEERFIRASIARQRNSRTRLVGVVTGVMIGLLGLSAVALLNQAKANREAIRANQQSIRSEANATEAFMLAHQPLKGTVAALMAWQQAKASGGSPDVVLPARAALVKALYYSKGTNLNRRLEPQGQDLIRGFKEKNILKGHSGSVWDVAFSPDGTMLATVSADKRIRLWDAATGEALNTLPSDDNLIAAHRNTIWSVVFSPDGTMLATASDDRTVKLWDVETGEVSKTLEGHSDWVVSAVFSPDGSMLATASADKTVKLWDVATGEVSKTLVGHGDRVNSVAFRPDGRTVASASTDQTVKLWDAVTGEVMRTLPGEQDGGEGHSDRILSVAFSLDGKTVATGSADQTVRLWNAATGDWLNTLEGHGDSIWRVTFSPDGNTLVTASADQTVKLWDAATGELLDTLEGHSDSVNNVAFGPEGETLVTVSADQTVRLWAAATGELFDGLSAENVREGEAVISHDDWVNGVVFSLDGRVLATASADQTVKLWDAATRDVLHTLAGHTNSVLSVVFSVDGTALATVSDDKTVRVWEVATGELQQTLPVESDEAGSALVLSAAFSPDNNTVMTISDDRSVKRWDVATGELQQVLPVDRGGGDRTLLLSAAFSPKGKTFATASVDHTVKLWDTATGEFQQMLEGHSSSILAVAFSADGTTLATASADQTVKLWDVATGELMHTLEGHSAFVLSVALFHQR